MKKKFIPIVAIAAIFGMGTLATSCNTPTPPVESSESSIVSSEEEVSSEVVEPSTPEEVRVESVALVLSKTTATVGETITATVTVSPENATNTKYTLVSLNTAVATVNGTTISAVAKGTAEIKVTTEDGAKTASATLTVEEPVLPAPTLNNPGEASYTVVAGVDLALPKITATSGDGKTDLTGSMEAEDFNDPYSLNDDLSVFNSKVAGVHVVSYYVEEGDLNATLNIEITVTPVHENTFAVSTEENNPENITTYGTFKDGFEAGYDSRLYKSLGDAKGAVSLSATDEAIEGNSVVIDFNKTAGDALNSVFVNTFTSAIVRDKSVTYEVEFDYKPLTESSFGDVYFGMRWDGYNGTNAQFVSTKTVGTVSHYKVTFSETTVPSSGGTAGFFFFKSEGDATPCKVAIDNFVVSTVKAPETTVVVPTAEELQAENGFTFDWKDHASTFGKGQTTLVENIEDDTIRTAITGAEGFGENVMHLTGIHDHTFAGLNSTNLVAGKKVTLSFKYYKVNDNGFNMILMVAGSGTTMNDGLNVVEVSGNIKQMTWTGVIPAGTESFNFYPTDGNYNIYMGNMTVKMEDADPIPEGETALGFKVGQTWTNTTRAFGTGSVAGGKATLEYIDTPASVSGEGIGDKISKITYLDGAAETVIEWYRPNQAQFETGHEYKITLVYYVESWTAGARLKLKLDSIFLPEAGIDTSVGYHKYEINWIADHAVDFFSFYVSESNGNSVVYVASSTVELVAIN
ncbi:MAG: Ig-like domain-containing protein [Candidatus Enteromonas sp.]|nr:Ig-like domain-containing protein [Candidatus Enteromonas sp.]